LPTANDSAAVLGVDKNRAVPQLENSVDTEMECRLNPGDDMDVDVETQKCMVKMVVMDGIVMGPTYCAFDNCTGPLANACGPGESFCSTHRSEFWNCCYVCNCENNRVDGTQACQAHHNEWYQYTQS
jgi:hypothetical protein